MPRNLAQMRANAPKEPQRIIRKLLYYLTDMYPKGEIPYVSLPETMIDESQTSPTPDLLLYDIDSQRFVVIMEISSTQGFKKDFQKIEELCQSYEVPEGFAYDYLKNQWQRYALSDDQAEITPSYCQTIACDLSEALAR